MKKLVVILFFSLPICSFANGFGGGAPMMHEDFHPEENNYNNDEMRDANNYQDNDYRSGSVENDRPQPNYVPVQNQDAENSSYKVVNVNTNSDSNRVVGNNVSNQPTIVSSSRSATLPVVNTVPNSNINNSQISIVKTSSTNNTTTTTITSVTSKPSTTTTTVVTPTQSVVYPEYYPVPYYGGYGYPYYEGVGMVPIMSGGANYQANNSVNVTNQSLNPVPESEVIFKQ